MSGDSLQFTVLFKAPLTLVEKFYYIYNIYIIYIINIYTDIYTFLLVRHYHRLKIKL